MNDKDERVLAIRVRRGEQVQVRGRWLEVKAARLERYASGGSAVIFLFQSAPALRVSAGERIATRPGTPEVRR